MGPFIQIDDDNVYTIVCVECVSVRLRFVLLLLDLSLSRTPSIRKSSSHPFIIFGEIYSTSGVRARVQVGGAGSSD